MIPFDKVGASTPAETDAETTATEQEHARIENSRLDAALTLSREGWSVFPCHSIVRAKCTCSKGVNCGEAGKHPRTPHGSKDATTDEAKITNWWTRWPDANVAVNVGMSGLVVVDVDLRKDGFLALENLGVEMPKTLTASTGGAGRHYVFRTSTLRQIHGRNNWRTGIDVKASVNDYVVVAPSSHISGGRYKWNNWGTAPAEIPADLLELLPGGANDTTEATGLPDTEDILKGVPEGERDDRLFRLACRLRRQTNSRTFVEAAVRLAASRSSPPFPDDQAIKCVDSAFKQDHDDNYQPWMGDVALLLSEAAIESRPGLNLVRASEMRQRRKPPMLVEDVLPPGALFQVFGQTGTYKSFVMVDLLCSIANGIDWMGHKVNDPGPVALVLGEGGWDAGNRIAAWLDAHPEANDDRVVFSIEEGLDLMDWQQVQDIIDDLTEWREREHPGDAWKVIVFDTQADHMPSGDEDKSKDFTTVKKAIQRISKMTGAAVGLVHHTGWDDSRERGSSRQRQALDVVIQIKDSTISNVKQKFAATFPPIKFTTEPVQAADSIYVRLSDATEQMHLAFEGNQVKLGEDGRRALQLMVDQPGISGNVIAKTLSMRKQSWAELRDWMEANQYIAVTKSDRGVVTATVATDLGLEWLSLDGSES